MCVLPVHTMCTEHVCASRAHHVYRACVCFQCTPCVQSMWVLPVHTTSAEHACASSAHHVCRACVCSQCTPRVQSMCVLTLHTHTHVCTLGVLESYTRSTEPLVSMLQSRIYCVATLSCSGDHLYAEYQPSIVWANIYVSVFVCVYIYIYIYI